MSLTLHFHPLASYCHKVLIALYENDTPFTPHMVDLSNASERAALLKLWPIGKFPVLRDDAQDQHRSGVDASSSSISTGTIRERPNSSPPTPSAREQTRLSDRFYDLYVHEPMQKIVGDRLRHADKKDPYGVEEAKARLAVGLRYDRGGDDNAALCER